MQSFNQHDLTKYFTKITILKGVVGVDIALYIYLNCVPAVSPLSLSTVFSCFKTIVNMWICLSGAYDFVVIKSKCILNMNPNATEIVRIGTDKVQCMVLA